MHYVTISESDHTRQNSMTNLAWITFSKLYYDTRYKRYEFRTTKSEFKKYKPLYEAMAKVFKSEIHEWNSKEIYSENIYITLKG